MRAWRVQRNRLYALGCCLDDRHTTQCHWVNIFLHMVYMLEAASNDPALGSDRSRSVTHLCAIHQQVRDLGRKHQGLVLHNTPMHSSHDPHQSVYQCLALWDVRRGKQQQLMLQEQLYCLHFVQRAAKNLCKWFPPLASAKWCCCCGCVHLAAKARCADLRGIKRGCKVDCVCVQVVQQHVLSSTCQAAFRVPGHSKQDTAQHSTT